MVTTVTLVSGRSDPVFLSRMRRSISTCSTRSEGASARGVKLTAMRTIVDDDG